ncbi:hypothetical protein [Natronoarchaeum rubrum]|uniref:hypothetical protein n=1 Tax=Natronoarchaeum rubrum TaxID=755311 RepID=UPI002112EE08|nr:hypothetical protein [Natronoarchaeum rubrum]HMB50470.1 hypothetical protein [Natronoarchaeum rubrum]
METASIDLLPAFLRERFDELDPAALRAAAEYAAGDRVTAPDSVPDDVTDSFALQDDETLATAAVYAHGLARGKALSASVGATDDASEVSATDSDEERDDWWEDKFY